MKDPNTTAQPQPPSGTELDDGLGSTVLADMFFHDTIQKSCSVLTNEAMVKDMYVNAPDNKGKINEWNGILAA